MKTSVIYFSRTGNSKRIADKIASKLDCQTTELTDDVSWKGIWGWLKGGLYSLNGKTTNVKLSPETEVGEMDTIILVVPLWAGNVAPAGYSFLMKEIKSIKRLFVVIDNDGSDVGKTFSKLEATVGALENKYGITKQSKNEDEVIGKICEAVSKSI